MDRFISFIHENWDNMTPAQIAGYGLWRLNWIHPFIEGNGRTARAVCYYLLCVSTGKLLPGKKTVPERIRESREPYVAALRDADRHWAQGNLNLTLMEAYIAGLLENQLGDDDTAA